MILLRIIAVQPSTFYWNIRYNGDGMRFSRTDANGTNSFAWNGKVLDAQLGAGNTVSTWYTQGMGEYGDIISTRDASADASSLQLYDASGNVNQTTARRRRAPSFRVLFVTVGIIRQPKKVVQ